MLGHDNHLDFQIDKDAPLSARVRYTRAAVRRNTGNGVSDGRALRLDDSNVGPGTHSSLSTNNTRQDSIGCNSCAHLQWCGGPSEVGRSTEVIPSGH